MWTKDQIKAQLIDLGLCAGDIVMIHSGLRSIGSMQDGAQTLLDALQTALGPDGTLMVYTDWETDYQRFADTQGHVPASARLTTAPFDPNHSKSAAYIGVFPEFVRQQPLALRSAAAGASCAAIGPKAKWLTDDHALDYGYGPDTPFGKLVSAEGKVMLLGAPRDTVTLLHHAEHLANLPNKRVRRLEVPFKHGDQVDWRMCEEFDTGDPVITAFADDYFGTIVSAFLAAGFGRTGQVGHAPSVLLPAAPLVAFGVNWMEKAAGA